MDFRILGPLEVVVDGVEPARLGRGKQLALLAVLLLNANRAVSVDRLVDDLWGESAPATATKAVQIYVWKLRKVLPEGLLRTRPPGYLIEVGPEELDLMRFERLAAEGRNHLQDGKPSEASDVLGRALALWRGSALSEFSEPFAAGEAARLEELRLACLEDRLEADLAIGSNDVVAAELEALVVRHPLRERLRVCQMLALYRAGRHADALAAYQEFRRLLDEQLGMEPSQRVRDLQRRMLRQSDDLELPPSAPRTAAAGPPDVVVAEPPSPVAAMSAGGGSERREPQRRRLTVLSCDLAAAEQLAGELDAEDFRDVVSAHCERCASAIARFDGTVARIQGSRVLAVFGYPRAHEDDARRAVAAGASIARGDPQAPPVRVAVDTGVVVVEEGEQGLQAIGEAAVAAERLERLAAPGEVLVGATARSQAAPYFDMGPRSFDENGAVDAYVVIGQSDVASRFEVAASRGFTRFTGRAAEVGVLEAALEKTMAGHGQVVTVVGQAGMGKSRLVREFLMRPAAEPAAVLEARCPSVGGAEPGASYLPFVELLSRVFELARVEGIEELERTVVTKAVDLDRTLERYLPYYLQLLSISSERYRTPPRFMGEEKRRAFEEALGALLTVLSRQAPLVVLLEDWHWSDEASDSALRYLAGAIATFPILLVVTRRPGHEPDPLAALGHHTSVVVRALDRAETELLGRFRLGVESLPEGLGSLLYTTTDGNPLFVEELCSALIDDGTVEVANGSATLTRPPEGIALPDTVEAVIRSRLDALGPEEQDVLRLASVVGRQFGRDILERLAHDTTAPAAALSRLVAYDLIQQVSVVPDVEYAFKHVLVQVVVYESLLRQRRRELHAAAGEAIEEAFPDRHFQLADSLAHHYELGEVWDKAVIHRVHAGVRAFEHHAVGSALRHFARAEALLAASTPAVGWRDRFDLAFYRGAALGERGRWPAAYDAFELASGLADAADAETLQTQAAFAWANAAFWAHRFDDSLRLAAKLEELVGDRQDARLGVVAMQALTSFMCAELNGSLEKERELQALYGAVPGSPYAARAAFVLGVFRRWRGDSREAASYLAHAVELDREHASVGVYLQSLLHYCLALGDLGRYQEAIGLLLEARARGEQADSLYGVLKIDNTLGWLYQELFNYPESLRFNELCLVSTNEARGTDTSTLSEIDAFARLNLGDLLLAMGDTGRASEFFESAWAHVDDDEYVLARTRWQARCLLGLGDVALGDGDVAKAEEVLDDLDAHRFTDAFPFKKLQARALRLRAGILVERGDHAEAVVALEQALDRARSVGGPAQIWRTELALGDAAAARREDDEADEWYRRAATTVQHIADGLDDELRGPFEQSPPMRAVIAKARGESTR
jgi:DNA-binding SARP family transcriptional activator/class 3 adenylate cyclase